MNDYSLTRAQFCGVDQRLPRCQCDDRHRCSLHISERLRLGCRFVLRGHRILGVAAAILQANVRVHRIAYFKLRDLRAGFLYNSGNIRTWNHRERRLFIFRKHSRSDHPIHRVHARCNHANENLIVFRLRKLGIFILQNLRTTVIMHHNRFHSRPR